MKILVFQRKKDDAPAAKPQNRFLREVKGDELIKTRKIFSYRGLCKKIQRQGAQIKGTDLNLSPLIDGG